MNKSLRWFSGVFVLTLCLVPATGAQAFWAVRGAHGGFAMGGIVRAPLVVDRYYGGGCFRCAPLYAPGAVAAGAAVGAAAGAAAATAAAPPPSSSPPPSAPPPSSSASASPPPSANAPSSAQPSCVSSLSPDARTIYNASRSAGANASNLRDVVTAQTRALVMAGKIPQSTAKSDAQSAGQCLAQAK